MNHTLGIDTLLTNIETDPFFANGVYSSCLWYAATVYAGACVDIQNAGDRISQARSEVLDKRLDEALSMISWAYLRTKEELRPSAENIVNRLVNSASREPTDDDVARMREMQETIDDDDVLPFSPQEIKKALIAQRDEKVARVERAREYVTAELTSAFKTAEGMPADLNEGFVPTRAQAQRILNTVVEKGRRQYLRNQIRAGQPGLNEKFAATLLGNNRLIKSGVKNAEALLHEVLVESENASSEAFGGIH